MSPPLSDLPGYSPRLTPQVVAVEAPWWGDREPAEEDDGTVDHFDRLPDSVLLLVFNKIGDIKSLGRSCAVSRRFHALVPLVDDVLVRVDCVISDDGHSTSSTDNHDTASSADDKPRGSLFSHLARLVLGGIVRPLQAIGQILAIPSIGGGGGGGGGAANSLSPCSSASSDHKMRHSPPPAAGASSSDAASSDVSHHSPTEVLRNFKEIRRLRIELPAGELGVDDGALLKWKADFGSSLNSCVILGASSVLSSSSSAVAEKPSSLASDKVSNANNTGCDAGEGFCRANGDAGSAGDDSGGGGGGGGIPESFYTNGSLKLRVVWTISSLIAASARHYLLQPIIAEHGTLERLDLTDGDGQGVLEMDRGQLEELRVKPVSASGFSQRTLVPALNMRLWYAQQLELAGGMVLQGATLVAIRPTEKNLREQMGGEGAQQDMSWVTGALREPYGSAVRQLVKGRMYCLEMNSF